MNKTYRKIETLSFIKAPIYYYLWIFFLQIIHNKILNLILLKVVTLHWQIIYSCIVLVLINYILYSHSSLLFCTFHFIALVFLFNSVFQKEGTRISATILRPNIKLLKWRLVTWLHVLHVHQLINKSTLNGAHEVM